VSLHPEDGAIVRSVADELKQVSRQTNRIEIALVAVGTVAFVIAAVAAVFTLLRLADLVEQNRAGQLRAAAEERERDQEAREEEARRAEARLAGDRLASDAVLCIVGELREHRVADRAILDRIVKQLRVTYDLPDDIGPPQLPTATYRDACRRFEEVVANGHHRPG